MSIIGITMKVSMAKEEETSILADEGKDEVLSSVKSSVSLCLYNPADSIISSLIYFA